MEQNFQEAGYVYLNSENEKRLSIYFNPDERDYIIFYAYASLNFPPECFFIKLSRSP